MIGVSVWSAVIWVRRGTGERAMGEGGPRKLSTNQWNAWAVSTFHSFLEV